MGISFEETIFRKYFVQLVMENYGGKYILTKEELKKIKGGELPP